MRLNGQTMVDILDHENKQIGILWLSEAIKLFRWFKIGKNGVVIERVNEATPVPNLFLQLYIISKNGKILEKNVSQTKAIFRFIDIVFNDLTSK